MTHEAAGERAQEVRATARATRLQLQDWQRLGLLPRPHQHGLGRGRGSTVVYPPGSANQAVAIRGALAEKRSLRDARWRLWWEGWVIEERGVRELLATLIQDLHAFQDAMRRLQNLRDPPQGEADARRGNALAGRRLPEKVLRAMRRRIGAQHWDLALLLLEMAAGSPSDDRGSSDANPLVRAVDPQTGRTFPWRTAVRAFFNPGAWGVALGNASDPDLRQAREELRLLYAPVGVWADRLVPSRQPQAATLLTLARAAGGAPFFQQCAVLGWLAWQTPERGQQLHASLMQAVLSLHAGQPIENGVDARQPGE